MELIHSSAGIPAAAICRMLDRWEESGVCMHGFILSRDGQTAAQGYWAPIRECAPHRMFSVSKSMTSLAVGLLEADGKLRLSDFICDYFPDKLPDAVPGPLRRLTLRDMLRMATCHRFTTYKLASDPDWTKTFFTVPPTHEPGTVFCYDTSASHTLAALAERLTGMPLLQFLQTRLFDRVGAADEKTWLADPVGVSQGGTGLSMTLGDLAKVAAFCLDYGQGTELEGYLRRATAKQIETPLQERLEEQFGYGYQFWRVRNGGFCMYGMGGQLAVCFPEHKTMLCTIADTQLDSNGVQKIYDALWQEIWPCLAGGAPSPSGGGDALSERLRALAIQPVGNDFAFAAPRGREYALSSNSSGLGYVCLRDGELVFENASGRHTLPFGIGSWAGSVFPGAQQPCIASGGWIAPGVFRLQCHLIGESPCGMELLLSFLGDAVTVQMRSVRNSPVQKFSGVASGNAVQAFFATAFQPSRPPAFRWA